MRKINFESLFRSFRINYSLISEKIYCFQNGLNQENKIFTHMTIDEKVTLHKILKSQNKKLICAEIGSYLGASTCFIANAILDNSRLYCIDTWTNLNMKYSVEDIDAEERNTYNEFITNTHKYSDKIIEIKLMSIDAINVLIKHTETLDFLFIDLILYEV